MELHRTLSRVIKRLVLLNENMTVGKYSEVTHQPGMMHALDVDLARERCRSFRKLMCEVELLVNAIAG